MASEISFFLVNCFGNQRRYLRGSSEAFFMKIQRTSRKHLAIISQQWEYQQSEKNI